MSEVRDDYHTLDELYDHRRALTAALASAMSGQDAVAWRSKAHHPDDDPIYEGYFIVGIDLGDVGTITYHYALEHWHDFRGVLVLDQAPKWDGATPEDTVTRLLAWASR